LNTLGKREWCARTLEFITASQEKERECSRGWKNCPQQRWRRAMIEQGKESTVGVRALLDSC